MKNDLNDGLLPGAKRFFEVSARILVYLCLIFCITGLSAIIAASLFGWRVGLPGNDSAPQQTLRNINSAQAVYQSGIGNGNYAPRLADLGSSSSTEVGLIDSTIVNAQTTAKSGYLLGEMKTVPRTATSPARYSITAFPVGGTGDDRYYIDETGIIRHSGRPDVPATAASEPVKY